MSDETDPDLFLDAQNAVWDQVTSELAAGRKQSHWMWFVFPQLASLGQSPMSQLYGLHDLAEARAYLAHPELRARLVEVGELLLSHRDACAETILGRIDAMKLRSSMTLFAAVPDAPPVFADILGAFFDGRRCEHTLQEIGGA
ncbi:DUF1810 domain-containing protein [Pukyongiella litopenaei]|uniref:DUF1810 domain-containing protein n=1 Tax=Pukyongiella litopenaei TaxID=2605946 RepID=A0A2S0MPQ3_9RHOB|nr:DUF1810 domain-containing protein [Pukyongiella litopenaei]AVO37855.1 DUF1810 domain-containing protein [Pukyongiella litopenaei]